MKTAKSLSSIILSFFCYFFIVLTIGCRIETTNPLDAETDKTKLTVIVPANIDADIYKISIVPEDSDTTIYFENASTHELFISVPSQKPSQIIINAYKGEQSTLVFSGSTLVPSGQIEPLLLETVNNSPVIVAPTELSLQSVLNTSVSLSWMSSENATSYCIFRKTDNDDEFIEVGCATDLSLVDNTVLSGTTYQYYIIAKNSITSSEPSQYLIVNVPQLQISTKPSTPQNIVVQTASENSITVSWDEVAFATSYFVETSISQDGIFSLLTTTSNSLTIGPLTPSTTYYCKVTAVNDAGESTPSQVVSGRTGDKVIEPPTTPENVTITNMSQNAITAKWDLVSSASSYIVDISNSEQGPFSSHETPSNTHTFESLTPATTYYCRVIAVNNAGESAPSQVASGRTSDETPSNPTTPENVIISTVSQSAITVNWDKVASASSYIVDISTSEQGPFTSHEVTSNTHTFESLTPSTTYYCKITAVNNSGKSSPSQAISVRTADVVILIPTIPSNVTAKSISETSIEISWNSVENATSYTVEWAIQSEGPFSSDNVTSTNKIIGSLKASTTYYCRVSAANSAGQSDLSSFVSAKTLEPALQPPESPTLTATTLSDTSIQISWSSVTNAANYTIERATISSGPFTNVCTTTTKSTSDVSLQSNTTYYYRGKAINSAGSSSYSSTVTAKTAQSLLPPSGLSVTGTTDNSITVTWQSVNGAESYNIYISSSESGTYQAAGTSKTASYTINNIESNTSFYIKVTSIMGTQVSSFSEVVSARTNEVLSPPNGVKATAESSTSIVISFDKVSGATEYIIYSGVSSNSLSSQTTVSSTTYTHTSLEPSKTYYYAVAAMSSSNTSSKSPTVQATTQAEELAIPSGLKATVKSSTSIDIAFEKVTNATEYIIYSGTSSSSLNSLATISSTTYTHTGLEPSKTYYYAVAAINSSSTSSKSSTVQATTQAEELAIPSGLKATVKSSTSIDIAFEKVTNATEYIIYSGTSSSSLNSLATILSTTYTHTGLEPSKTYYYAVAAMNSSSTSSKSSTVQATTQADAPSTPSNLKATAESSSSIKITFSSASGATGYILYWSKSNSNFSQLTTLTSTSYTHKSLSASTTYYYKVSAINGSSESLQSSSVSAKTDAATVTKVAVIGSGCVGCGRCVSACSQGAISKSGRIYVIDASKCNGCGSCIARCPKDAISLK